MKNILKEIETNYVINVSRGNVFIFYYTELTMPYRTMIQKGEKTKQNLNSDIQVIRNSYKYIRYESNLYIFTYI